MTVSAAVPSGADWRLPWHIPSHRGLVPHLSAAPYRPARPRLDAVVVPASRPAVNLRHAARVTAALGAHLLALCSGAADPQEVYREVRRHLDDDAVTVVDVPQGWAVPRLSLRADELPMAGRARNDTSLKRNVAVLVARSLAWERLLFLDDDVRGLDPGEIRRATSVLDRQARHAEAVGWAVDEFPDNSVVCHAYREAGGWQDTFIGGGTLLVRMSEWVPHFPTVYNEDWLFMLPLMLRSRSALVFAGTMRQEVYDPFSLTARASRQEFGDVLAEGLFRLLHRGPSFALATSEGYWRDELTLRSALIHAIRGRLDSRLGSGDDPVAERACTVLDEAAALNSRIGDRPLQLAEWVSAWLGDREIWAARLAEVSACRRTDDALADLGLDVVRTPPDGSSGAAASAGPG